MEKRKTKFISFDFKSDEEFELFNKLVTGGLFVLSPDKDDDSTSFIGIPCKIGTRTIVLDIARHHNAPYSLDGKDFFQPAFLEHTIIVGKDPNGYIYYMGDMSGALEYRNIQK